MLHRHLLFILTGLLFILACENYQQPIISLVYQTSPDAQVEHGINKIKASLQALNVKFEEVNQLDDARGSHLLVVDEAMGENHLNAIKKEFSTAAESYVIRYDQGQDKKAWLINGSDASGTMYGLLEVADRIERAGAEENPLAHLVEQNVKPEVAERALSIYTMQRAYWESRFYDENHWVKYLDNMARNRFNSLVLIFGYENGGFLAPVYPYFFDVEGFPEVYMEGHSTQDQEKNLMTLNRLIEMAHARGIKFSVGIWDHIYRGGVQSGGPSDEEMGENAKYLVQGVTADNLVEYTKAGLKKFLEEVPQLDGLQLRIHWESGLTLEEQKTFFPEIFQMIKKDYPQLKVDLRAKELPDEIIANAIETGLNFRVATKYWMEQMGMPYHPTKTNPEKSHRRHGYEDLLIYPKQYDVHWRLWNGGTNRILLWGNPDYVQRFVASTKLYGGNSFEVNEPLATKMEAQPHNEMPFELHNKPYHFYEYEFERYWYFYQTFGRVSYHSASAAETWKHEFVRRFGNEAAPILETAINKASWILPRIITSVYPYREFPMTRGWAEKERLRDLPDYANSQFSDLAQFATFAEEAELLLNDGETARMLPSENSHWFYHASDSLNQLISQAEKIQGLEENMEFQTTLVDLKILSNLSQYHARRIPAGVYYCLFEKTNNIEALQKALEHEKNAMHAWQQIVEVANDVYHRDLKMGFCGAGLCGHWQDELDALQDGIATLETQLKNFKPNGPVTQLPDYQPLTNQMDHSLFSINHAPVSDINEGESIHVTIKVESQNPVKWVHLRYRSVNQEYAYDKILMNRTLENTFEITIPSHKIDWQWDQMYYFEIMDEPGNGIIFPDLSTESPYIFVKINRKQEL